MIAILMMLLPALILKMTFDNSSFLFNRELYFTLKGCENFDVWNVALIKRVSL